MLNDVQGQTLIQVAKAAIETAIQLPERVKISSQQLSDPVFQTAHALFVTLSQQKKLRGCIGCLTATEPLLATVRCQAVAAALHDPRFPPVQPKEWPEIRLSLSILTVPKRLTFQTPDQLLTMLRPQIDGVILTSNRNNAASATFLPQVWDQLPNPAHFLSQLCQKAGLASDEWHTHPVTIQTYQVQYFEEHRPRR